MTEVVRIGASLHSGKPRPTRRLVLPAKLTLEACVDVLVKYDPDFTVENIAASKGGLDLWRIDSLLEVTEQSTSDCIRFKRALEAHGLLARGKKLGA
jgi:hypothetical protein